MNDIERHPALMEPVIAVEVHERGPAHRVATWQVEMKGCVMRWVEREDIDAEHHRIEYRQVEGDLSEFCGHWQLSARSDDTTAVVLTVHFEIGTPMLAEMLDPIAERAILENSRSMLGSLAAYAVTRVG